MKRIVAIMLLGQLAAGVRAGCREGGAMDGRTLLDRLAVQLDGLRPQSIRPAEGFIRRDYLVPGGFYKQMWDWDGFFIGCHLLSLGQPGYLRDWVLGFAEAADAEGYVPGCITTQGPRPIFGKFAMKPFLAQGAYLASEALGDYRWLEAVYAELANVCAYREATQFDAAYGLFFWDNAMQSGADNTVVLTNDDRERSAILAVDLNTFQYREYKAMRAVAAALGHDGDAAMYAQKAALLRENILKHHWDAERYSFWNVRRRDGRAVRRVSYSNFTALMEPDLLPLEEGREMVRRYLWNDAHMLSPHGLRTLSRQDPDYNNENIIVPYSNWQGPIWPIANYLFFIGLKNYGFDAECGALAAMMARLVSEDIAACGSMHENYDAETGAPLAPTAEQSGGVFKGFVGWNMLVLNMLEGVCGDGWLLLEIR